MSPRRKAKAGASRSGVPPARRGPAGAASRDPRFARQAEAVLRQIRDRNVKFIRIWFVDDLGQLKSFSVTDREMEKAFREGMGFDGSSIEGFARIEESDLLAVPDPATFCILPWRPEEHAVGRLFCDILTPEGAPYEGDTRYVLKRNLEEIAGKGLTFQVGPELEYFYFRNDTSTEPLDSGGYFDTVPLDEAQDLRRDSILYLERMGIPVEYSHHEVAPSQHEIDLLHGDALTQADRVITYKVVVKQVARAHSVYASFMPKPMSWVNGSGMHVHMSLFEGKRNVFFDARDAIHLSAVAKKFLAGLLRFAPEICAVTNQWVNSYKRLTPGYEAPVYVSWARRNRSTLVRVPQYKPGKEGATRIEARFPDPACNPYLAFAVLLAAGMEGVKRGLELPEPVEMDVYRLSEGDRQDQGISSLPGSLKEALDLTSRSELVRRALGDHVFGKFIQNKAIEWDRFRAQVTNYEIEKYLPIL